MAEMFRLDYLQALLESLPSSHCRITICTTITPCRSPPHRGRMPKRRYQHRRRNVRVMDAARRLHSPRPYASCAKRSHYAKSMELELAPPAMQHLPPQRPNSLKCLLRIHPFGSLSQGSSATLGPRPVCTFAVTCLMRLANTGLVTQHLQQPTETVTAQQPMDVQATPCLPENSPFGPHTHEEERLRQPISCFPLLRTKPGTILIIRSGRCGGTTYRGYPDGDELRVLRRDQVPREMQNVADPMILFKSGLVVQNPKEAVVSKQTIKKNSPFVLQVLSSSHLPSNLLHARLYVSAH